MRTIALVLLALIPPSRGGEEPDRPPRQIRITLRQSFHMALNHNLDIEVSRYQPWIEDQNVLAATGTFDFVLYASGSGGENLIPTASALSGATTLDQDSAAFTVGVRKLIPFGATLDASLSTNRTLTNSSFATLNPQWQNTLGLSLTIPVLKGAGVTSNTATVVVARHTRDASVHAFEKALIDALFAIEQAYWDLVFAIENRKVKLQSLEVAQKLLDENRKKYERGTMAKIDVTQAEAGVASQQEGILTAENAVQDASDRLKRLIDPALLREDAVIVPVDEPKFHEREIEEKAVVEAAMGEALSRRSDYRQLVLQIKSQDVTLAKSERDRLPKLDVTASATVTGLDDHFGGANSEIGTADFHNLTLGFVFEFPLGQSSATGTRNRAELERRRLELQRRNLEFQILVEVRAAVRQIKTNEKRIEATRKARVLTQEQFDAEKNRQEQGLSTTFRVLDVHEDLTLARTNEVKALIDYRLSLANLEKVTGALLEKHDILLKDNLAPRLRPYDR